MSYLTSVKAKEDGGVDVKERMELLQLLAAAREGVLSLEVKMDCVGVGLGPGLWARLGEAFDDLEEVIENYE